MLRVLSDALTTANDRQVTLIALLDLSSAFDCVHHELLLRRLQYNFRFTDNMLRWMTSFVSGRTQQVSYTTVSCRPTSIRPVYSSEFHRGPSSAPPLRLVHCRLE